MALTKISRNLLNTGVADSSDATAITIDSSENVTVNTGNLVIGTSGKGIDFSSTGDGSGTMSSEVLDDYEEGSWTPTAPQTTTLAILYGAKYIKIGRMVHAKCYIGFTPANNTTTFTIDGLPYTADNVTDYGQGSVGYVNQSNINKLCDPIVNPNTKTIIFYYNDGTNGGSSVKNNFWHTATSGGNQLIIVSVLYQAA